MRKEWWELTDDESRIMSLYRRFDAMNQLSAELWFDRVAGSRRNEDIEGIVDEVAMIFPVSSLDFIAQSVMLADANKISLTPGQLSSYTRRLDHYVESDYVLSDCTELLMEDEVLYTWTRFCGIKAMPIVNRTGTGSLLLE